MAQRHSRAGRIATVVLPILALTAAVLIGWSMPWQSFIMVGSPVSQAQSGGYIQTLTAPVSANFTTLNFNVGTNVVTTQTNNSTPVTSITVNQHDPNGTSNQVALVKSPVAATFTITGAFSAMTDTTQGLSGLFLADSGTNNLFLCAQNAFGLRAPVFTNFTGGFSADVFSAIALSGGYPSGLIWLRIKETASARNYYYSSDGINFTQIATESNTAHFTTTRYGFGTEVRGTAGDSTVTVYSFTETNP